MASACGVKHVNENEFVEIIKGEKLIVCDFFATWCGPCKALAPKLDELAKEKTDVVFIKVDVDECEDLATKYDVTAMPTIVLFKGGAEVGRVVGANLDQIKEMVETKSK